LAPDVKYGPAELPAFGKMYISPVVSPQ